MNSKEFGNLGLSVAINYFVFNNYKVSLPINDSQKYDLIVDDGILLQRVSVRTTSSLSEYGIPIVHLRTTGGNQSFNYAKHFDKKSCDLLFAYCPHHGIWCVPTENINNVNTLSLGKKCEQFRVMINI